MTMSRLTIITVMATITGSNGVTIVIKPMIIAIKLMTIVIKPMTNAMKLLIISGITMTIISVTGLYL